MLGCLTALPLAGVFAQSPTPKAPVDLTLDDYLKRVVERNESIQVKILEVEFNQRRLVAERGTFEPAFFADLSHVATERQNSLEQRNSQSGSGFYKDKNNIYEGGVEALVPTGARLRLGYTLRELNNNLPIQTFSSIRNTNTEYQTFFGLSLAQPLLKGAWFPANLAAIRVAGLSSDLAFQECRGDALFKVTRTDQCRSNTMWMSGTLLLINWLRRFRCVCPHLPVDANELFWSDKSGQTQ